MYVKKKKHLSINLDKCLTFNCRGSGIRTHDPPDSNRDALTGLPIQKVQLHV